VASAPRHPDRVGDKPPTSATVDPDGAADGDPGVVHDSARSATAGHMRGSSLLLVGRVLSLGVNFVVQVLIARYLSQTAYGAWAYALSLVVLGQTLATLGLDRGASRFLAVYDERKDYARLLGTILMVIGTVLSIGLALILLVIGGQSLLTDHLVGNGQAVSLLVILVFLTPIQALDDLMGGVLAVFSQARAIFLRKYVLGPLFRLTVVILLVMTSQDVTFLAIGYVVAGGVGLLLYAGILWRSLGERGIREHLRLREARLPIRELLAFTIPLMSTDLVYASLATTDAIVLQHFWGSGTVAAYRVIQPLATMNQLVFSSFTLLYLPAAARLFARDDRTGVAHLYWRTAIWVAVFSFPVFAITTTLAGPVTTALYEQRYSGSAPYLAVVSIGYYLNAAFGFNGLTLRVYGFLRYILVSNLVVVLVNIGLNLALVPHYGPMGGAIATASTLVLHNVIKQLGLRRGTGIDVFDWQYLRVYVVIAVAAGALAAVQLLLGPPLYVGVGLAAIASLIVLFVNRHLLDMAETFPELARIPGLRRLLT
jgi:O-antigen/teichoic acid export membrane protein